MTIQFAYEMVVLRWRSAKEAGAAIPSDLDYACAVLEQAWMEEICKPSAAVTAGKEEAMIKPTIGRVVWYHPKAKHDQPFAAIITYVHSDTMVNLAVFGAEGNHIARESIYLRDADSEAPNAHYCEWMPYQLGQAAKTEQSEARLAAMDPAKA